MSARELTRTARMTTRATAAGTEQLIHELKIQYTLISPIQVNLLIPCVPLTLAASRNQPAPPSLPLLSYDSGFTNQIDKEQ